MQVNQTYDVRDVAISTSDVSQFDHSCPTTIVTSWSIVVVAASERGVHHEPASLQILPKLVSLNLFAHTNTYSMLFLLRPIGELEV